MEPLFIFYTIHVLQMSNAVTPAGPAAAETNNDSRLTGRENPANSPTTWVNSREASPSPPL